MTMFTRILHSAGRMTSIAALVTLTACVPPTSPNEADIEEAIRAESATLAGTWRGFSQAPEYELLTLDVTMTQSGTAITGTGRMQEKGQADSRPVSVTGSYSQPRATLTISGMQFEGRAVSGLLRATNTVGIMADTLVLTGENYERKLVVFMSRQ